jgi:hypothetical protein
MAELEEYYSKEHKSIVDEDLESILSYWESPAV